MAGVKYAAIKGAFEVLAVTQLANAIRMLSRSKGVIFTLHRVLPDVPAAFSPNAILQVTPRFLDYAIDRVREMGLDIVDLDEAIRRIETRQKTRKFVVFTFDDAYRDNLQYALPILQKRSCPFTLYVPTALVDGVGEVWWQALEDIIAKQDAMAILTNGENDYLDTSTLAGKNRVYAMLYWRMRNAPEPMRVKMIRDLAERYGFDLAAHCRKLIMDWPALRAFADSRLCTIGAHTVHHYELRKLPADEARSEIEQSIKVLQAQFARTPTHLSFPIGGASSAGEREFAIARELGLRSAVTTRPGGLYHKHRKALTALPRVSLNGRFQAERFVDVFATGAVFSALGRFTG